MAPPSVPRWMLVFVKLPGTAFLSGIHPEPVQLVTPLQEPHGGGLGKEYLHCLQYLDHLSS
ncbi:hypothetical protein XENOCAPTIV_023642, partial [Xenoophorus captivus]